MSCSQCRRNFRAGACFARHPPYGADTVVSPNEFIAPESGGRLVQALHERFALYTNALMDVLLAARDDPKFRAGLAGGVAAQR